MQTGLRCRWRRPRRAQGRRRGFDEEAAVVRSGRDRRYFGGRIRSESRKEDRIDRRLAIYQAGKRRVVVALCERGGRTLPCVVAAADDAVPMIRARVATDAILHAAEAPFWDVLHARFEMRRINHALAYSDGDACTNQAESYFSRLRRAEIGQHHHISGPYLHAYAGEMAWREDTRASPMGCSPARG